MTSSRKTAEGFQAGERIAKRSLLTLLVIGTAEMVVGAFSGSLGLTADGIDSLFDAVVSMFVWVGLHFSRKRPDNRFHFGYHRVETLSALFMSIGMIGAAGVILYQSYLRFLAPTPLRFAPLALATLLIAGAVSLYRAFQMRAIAKKYNLLSLRTNAVNAIKDSTSSFVIFASVLGASWGFRELDAVGGMIVAVYLIGVAYITIREASLILLDATQSPEIVSELVAELKKIDDVRGIEGVKLRMSGPYVIGIITIIVDPKMALEATIPLRRKVRRKIAEMMEPTGDIHIEFMPDQAS